MELKLTHEILYQFRRVLLIVPYGIETIERTVLQDKHGLLIVPYGIETPARCPVRISHYPFNRTLWN